MKKCFFPNNARLHIEDKSEVLIVIKKTKKEKDCLGIEAILFLV